MKLPLAKQHWIAPQLWFGHNIAVLWWAAFLTVNGEVMCSFCVCATAANCSVPLLVKWKSSRCKFTYILFWAWLLSQEPSLQTLSSSRSLCYINFGKHFSFLFPSAISTIFLSSCSAHRCVCRHLTPVGRTNLASSITSFSTDVTKSSTPSLLRGYSVAVESNSLLWCTWRAW